VSKIVTIAALVGVLLGTTTTAGYCFIGDYGLTYRLAFTPAFTKDGFKPMGGAAFGKSF
jgi:hypothetical protein